MRMVFWPQIGFLGIFLSAICIGEPASAPQPSGYNPAAKYNLPTTNGLDADFFAPKAPSVEGAAKVGGRYAADEPTYDSGQYGKWVKSCTLKDGSVDKNCFQREKASTQQELETSRQKIEDRQNNPFQNAPTNSLPGLDGDPVFGGVKKD